MHQPAAPRAFTLIELLIVVAIIAILAAIAVPNFLEAQTRAKVSRALADMRTCALAIESYYVDNNSYPYSDSTTPSPWILPAGFPRSSTDRPAGLTTPIAYITSAPIDSFVHSLTSSSGTPTGETAPLYYERAGFGYIDGTKFTERPVPTPSDAVGNGRIDGIGASVAVTDANLTPRPWLLWSAGPDLTLNVIDSNGATFTNSRYHLGNRYDPTNGSVSSGNILYYPGGTVFPGG